MALASTETYCTLEQAKLYHAASFEGAEWAGLGDDNIRREQLLRAATRKMEAAIRWNGTPVSQSQPLAWPRTGLKTRNGADVPSNSIPAEIVNACAEFALRLEDESYSDDNAFIDLGIRRDGKTSYDGSAIRREVPSEVISMIPDSWISSVRGDGSIIPRKPSWC